MPPADPAAKAVEAWAIVDRFGAVDLNAIHHDEAWLALRMAGDERMIRVRITEITPRHGGDDE